MRVTLRLISSILSLLIASTLSGSIAAQTPAVDVADPCAGFTPATPAASSQETGEGLPAIAPQDAVLTSMSIHQRNVVTALDVIITTGQDDDLVAFARQELPQAKEQLDALNDLASQDAIDHPAALVAVLDQLRQERDLPADQGSLDAYLPGSTREQLCGDNSDREMVAAHILVASDTAIIEIAALDDSVIDAESAEVVDAVASSATDRLAWFDARSAGASPVATHQP